MRGLLLFVFIIVIYYALKVIVRSAISSYSADSARKQVKGEDMVLCPECRTYVVKDRAVTRRIGGPGHAFCSEACAGRYEQKHRE